MNIFGLFSSQEEYDNTIKDLIDKLKNLENKRDEIDSQIEDVTDKLHYLYKNNRIVNLECK